jgi:hypothetical protein
MKNLNTGEALLKQIRCEHFSCGKRAWLHHNGNAQTHISMANVQTNS